MKFSQQRIAIKNAKVNDEISPASLSCNSHSTSRFLKGRLQQVLLAVSTRQVTSVVPWLLFHQEKIRKILKCGEVNKTLPGS